MIWKPLNLIRTKTINILDITSTTYTMSNSRKYAKIILSAIGKVCMAPAEVGTGEVTVFEPEKKPEIK